VISTVCNPFITPLVLFVLMCGVTTRSPETFWVRLAVCGFFTSIGPMLVLFWLYLTGEISDLDMSSRQERERVFLVFVFSYLLGTLTLWAINAPVILVASMAGYTAAAFLVQTITRYWKISTHALGITAPLVVLTYLYGREPLPFWVLIPLVGWSRVYLKSHTVAQVVAGALLGAGSVMVFFRLFHVG
jgi:membrane-associated phospholipid phosphatase